MFSVTQLPVCLRQGLDDRASDLLFYLEFSARLYFAQSVCDDLESVLVSQYYILTLLPPPDQEQACLPCHGGTCLDPQSHSHTLQHTPLICSVLLASSEII